MATNRQYDHEFKVQAIKLAQEIGQVKAAKELGISKNTMYTWTRAHRLGYLDLGCGTQTPQSALSLHEELVQLRAQLKAQDKEMWIFVSLSAFAQLGHDPYKEPLINSAAHLHTSTLSSRRRQILDVAPLRLWFVSLLSRPRAKSEGRRRLGNGSYAKTSQECKREARRMIG